MTLVEGWSEKNLSELAFYVNGYAFKPEHWGKDGLPIIRIEQLKNPGTISDRFSGVVPEHNIIENGDLIFSWSASLFLRFWSHGKSVLNQHLFKVTPKYGVDKRFLKFFIEYNLLELTKSSHGSTMQHITRKELERFSALFPDNITEQAQIASVLSTIEQAIEETKLIITKQQLIKTGLMQDLLHKGIDEVGNIRSETTHKFKDSPLGRIPKEWNCKPLSYFVPSAEYGISSSLGEHGSPVLRMNNFSDGEAQVLDLKYSDINIPDRLWLKEHDVLFNRTNSWEHVGRTGIWRGQLNRATFASYLVRLNPNTDLLLPELLNMWLNAQPAQIAMRRLATPAVQQVNINPTNLRSIFAAFPENIEEQASIVEKLSIFRNAIKSNSEKLIKLEAQKRGLMQDLLTCKVRVNDLLNQSH